MTQTTRLAMQLAWGVRIQRVRMALDLSQVRLADETGVLKTTLNNWEKGRAPVPAWWLCKFAELYGVDPGYVLIGRMTGLSQEIKDSIRRQQVG